MADPGDGPTDGTTPVVTPPEHASTDSAVAEYPAGYPHEWAADVLGSDGRAVRIRPILPTDSEKVSLFHSSLSDRTRYLRYFGSRDVLSEKELRRMTHVDYRDRMAFVAELGAEIIGMAIYERLPDSTFAEVASSRASVAGAGWRRACSLASASSALRRAISALSSSFEAAACDVTGVRAGTAAAGRAGVPARRTARPRRACP